MATVLKRLLTVCLALAFLVGVTPHLIPASMAGPQTAANAQTGGGGCDGPMRPCTGHLPNCLDHGGCICGSVLTTLPAAVAVPVDWTSLDYDLPSQPLSGISVKPELAPPILAA